MRTLPAIEIVSATRERPVAPGSDAPSSWQDVIGIAAAAFAYQDRLHPAAVVMGGARLGLLLAR
jgi:hypothetical protein